MGMIETSWHNIGLGRGSNWNRVTNHSLQQMARVRMVILVMDVGSNKGCLAH